MAARPRCASPWGDVPFCPPWEVAASLRRLAGAIGMVFVGGSVAVSGAPDGRAAVHGAGGAVRPGLRAARRARGRRAPPGAAAARHRVALAAGRPGSGLLLFNVALVRGAEHAEPAVLGVAVACVPLVLAALGPAAGGQAAERAGAGCRAGRDLRCRAGAGRRPQRPVGLLWASWCSAARRGSPCWRCRCCGGTARGACPCTPRGSPRCSSPSPAWLPRDRPRSPRCRRELVGDRLSRRLRDGGGVRALVRVRGSARRRPRRPAHRCRPESPRR